MEGSGAAGREPELLRIVPNITATVGTCQQHLGSDNPGKSPQEQRWAQARGASAHLKQGVEQKKEKKMKEKKKVDSEAEANENSKNTFFFP